MQLELLGDAYILPIAFVVGVAGRFIVEKFKPIFWSSVIRPRKIFPFYETVRLRTTSRTSLKGTDLMGDYEVLTKWLHYTDEQAKAAIAKTKAKKLEDLKLQIIAQNPTGIMVPAVVTSSVLVDFAQVDPMSSAVDIRKAMNSSIATDDEEDFDDQNDEDVDEDDTAAKWI